MAELGQVEFEVAVERMKLRLNLAAAEIVQDLGGRFDPEAMVRQASSNLDHAARELLMFGGDFWPYGDDSPTPVPGPNVVPFVRRGRRVLTSMRAAAGTVARSAVVVASLLVIAAASSEQVNLPGMQAVAHYVYSKNAPTQLVRYIEHNGKFMRVEARRAAGEPFDVLHVVDVRPTEEAVALDLAPDPFETGTAVARGDATHDGKGRRIAPDALTATLG